MEKIEKIVLFGAGMIVLIFIILAVSARGKNTASKNTLIINGQKIKVEIADSASEKKKGLSGKESLAANTGMLFLFKKEGEYGFNMKDMRFPIDLVFIRGEEVVGVIKNLRLPQDDFTPSYLPPEPVDRVLELNAGEAEKFGIKKGTKIEFGF